MSIFRAPTRTIACIALLWAASSCSNGGDGLTSSGSGDVLVVVAGGLEAASGTPITKLDILWDGTVIASQSGSATSFASAGGSVTTSTGTHTLQLRATQQTVTSVSYSGSATVNTTSQALSNGEFDYGPTTKTLKAGESISFSVSVH